MPDKHKNFAYSVVATAPSPATSGTSLVVSSGQGTLFPVAPFNATVWPAGEPARASNSEIVRVTVKSTDTFTITRAQEGTTAKSVAIGWQIAATITARSLTDIEEGFVSAASFGAVGDDSTDDTTALQAWLNTTSEASPKYLYLPPGTYKITSALVVPATSRGKIIGAGRGVSIIKQYTAGQAILWFQSDLIHTTHITDLGLRYSSDQTNANSVAVRFEPLTGKGDYFFNTFERIEIQKAYDGIAITHQLNSGNAISPWTTIFKDINMADIKHTAIDFAGSNTGVPVVRLENITVFLTGGSIVNTGPCFKFSATEVYASMIDVEGWYNEFIYSDGGGLQRWNHVHLESHKFTTSGAKLVEIANDAGFYATEWSIAPGTTSTSLGTITLFTGYETAAYLNVDQIMTSLPTVSGTSFQLFGKSSTNCGKFAMGYVFQNAGICITPSSDSVVNGKTASLDFATGVLSLWNSVTIRSGAGSPENVVTAPIGSLYLRTDGSTSTTLYLKTTLP